MLCACPLKNAMCRPKPVIEAQDTLDDTRCDPQEAFGFSEASFA